MKILCNIYYLFLYFKRVSYIIMILEGFEIILSFNKKVNFKFNSTL